MESHMSDMSVKASSRIRVDSTIKDGVWYEIYAMTEKRRRELRKSLNPILAKVRKIQTQMQTIESDVKRFIEAEPTSETPEKLSLLTEKLGELNDAFSEIMDEGFVEVYIKWGLCEIHDLEVDGHAMTAKDVQDVPSRVYREIYQLCRAESELSEEEAKNSERPTTSGSLAQTSLNRSTAPSVDSADSLQNETAPATILN